MNVTVKQRVCVVLFISQASALTDTVVNYLVVPISLPSFRL